MAHERAGQPAQPGDLIDVAHVVTAYYTTWPDLERPRRSGWRSAPPGHRGSSLDGSFTEAHIVATTQAICDYRSGQGIAGPLFLGRDTHAPVRAGLGLGAGGAGRQRGHHAGRRRDRYTPTPALSHAILGHNRGRPPTTPAGPTGSSSPRRTTRRPTAASSTTRRTAARPTPTPPAGSPTGRTSCCASCAAGGAAGARWPGPARPTTTADVRLPRHLRRRPAQPCWTWTPIRDGRAADRRRPAGRRQRCDYWGEIAERHRPRPDGGEPAGRPDLAVHDAGLGRQDPDGLLVAVRDGLADRAREDVPDRHRQRRGRRPARHRHPGRRAAEPQPLPRGGDLVPVRRTATGWSAGRRDRQDPGLVVHDRPGRRRVWAGSCVEVPVGFKWFVPGLLDGSVGFGGEESAGRVVPAAATARSGRRTRTASCWPCSPPRSPRAPGRRRASIYPS